MTIQEISVDQLAPIIEQGGRVIDVREPAEFAEARIPGARLVPLGTVPDHIGEFTGPGTTYIVCRSGARSMHACEFVADNGVEVANVTGGVLAWVASGRSVVSGPA